jgi:hypothetical protein
MKQVIFLTFGGGGDRYYRAVNRILGEAIGMNIFTKRIGIFDSDLKSDTFFWDKMGSFIETHRRGYGYWSWKPYIIWKQLQEMSPGDILLYADAGCTFNRNGRERLLEWMNDFETKSLDIQVTTACIDHCTERKWTKKAMLDYFQVPDDAKDRPIYGGGVIFVQKNTKTLQFFEDMIRLVFEQNHLLTDEISSSEDPMFKENRHDQSLLSCKLYQNKENLKIKVIFDGSLTSKRIDPKAPILITRYR